jgi:hypothetical protein
VGEIADYYSERLWEAEFYGRGDNSRPASCKNCGETGLLWQQVGNRWQLFRLRGLTLKPHFCDPKKLLKKNASAFENLD